MKKSIQIIGLIASLLLMVACSNSDDNDSNIKGTVTFFHYITGISTLSLESESNDRGLGTIEYGNFGSGISLNVKNWDLTVTDLKDEEDGSDDEIILDGVNFYVKYNRRSIFALVGDYSADTIELLNLSLAYDDDRGRNDFNNDGVRDDKAQYINFSHINSALGDLDVYLVRPDKGTETLAPICSLTPSNTPADLVKKEVISFKQSTAGIRLPENLTKFHLRIAKHSDPCVEIYNSGERVLKDYLEQTIIIAPFIGSTDAGSQSQITAYYYGDGTSQKWLATESKGQVRVFNALTDARTGAEGPLTFAVTNSSNPDISGGDPLEFNDLSVFIPIPTEFVTYLVMPEVSAQPAFFDGAGPVVNVQDGESWTIIFFGRVVGGVDDTSSAVVVLEDDSVFTNKASFIITNAAYIADEEKRKPYNVHITAPNEPVSASSVDIPGLAYASYGHMTLNTGNNYKISITDESNLNFRAQPLLFNVEGGENLHFVLKEKTGGGFEIVQLIGEANAKRTTIKAAVSQAATGTPVTVTVQAKDRGANKLAKSGGLVTLSTTGSATIGAVTDNANGTYTATLGGTTAETVTVSGTIEINGVAEAISSTATVTFN